MHTHTTPYAGHVVEVTFRNHYNAYDMFSNRTRLSFSLFSREEINVIFVWRILLVYLLFSAGCLLFLVGFKILFFWYCLPKTVGLESLPNPLLLELEGFTDFEGFSF